MKNKPGCVFEVITNNHHYKIYYNGEVEGFPDDGKLIIINRIPDYYTIMDNRNEN